MLNFRRFAGFWMHICWEMVEFDFVFDLLLLLKLFNTTFTLEPTFTDLNLIRICFKTSINIYPFPVVDTRLWKCNNDHFQFSHLHLSLW